METPYVWAEDKLNRAEHLIRKALIAESEEMLQRATAAPSKDEAKPLYKAANALQSRSALTKALPEIQAHPLITLTTDDFDADDWFLNTPKGPINLRTGEQYEPSPKLLMSKATAVAPSSEEPRRWLAFIREATEGDEDLQCYLQKLIGYSLTGSTREQVLAFIYGPTRTGKSTFVTTVTGMLGSYSATADANAFAKARGSRHPADIAALAGSRLVTSIETEEGRAWDTQRVKQLTGGDEVAARFMRANFFTYKPRYQIIVVGNSAPEISGVDDALMRRLHVIPFDNHVPTDRVIQDLDKELEQEWPGILQWAIDGCLLWQEEGLKPPAAVQERTEEYRHEEDTVGRFIEECCELDPTAEVTRRALYEAWRRWCHQQGEEPGTLKQLRRRFKAKERELGFSNTRVWEAGGRHRGYEGITLVDNEEAWK